MGAFRRLAGALLLLSIGAMEARAQVAPVELARLIVEADCIVVGTVTRMEPREFAHVRVERVLKGPRSLATFAYPISPRWSCDVTSAEIGERALFFLVAPGRDPRRQHVYLSVVGTFARTPGFSVMHAGYGVLPVHPVDGLDHVVHWPGVIMPADMPGLNVDPKLGAIAPLERVAERIVAPPAAKPESK